MFVPAVEFTCSEVLAVDCDRCLTMTADELARPPFPSWFNPSMPPPEECVLSSMLAAAARDRPDQVFAKFEDGTTWTYADSLALSRQWARGLRALGVSRGDVVLVWLPNGAAMLRAWFAIAQLGAVFAPVNVAYRGDLLEHLVRLSGARVVIAHASLVPRLAELDIDSLKSVIAVGGKATDAMSVRGEQVLEAGDPTFDDWPQVMPWDTHAIICTSGTSGPSKGVLCSNLHFYTVGCLAVGFMDHEDTCMIHMPMFHIGAAGGIYGAIARRASVAIVEGFSTNRFWDQVTDMHCTTACGMVGSIVPFLASRPASPTDSLRPLRRVLVAPVDEQLRTLAARHGFEYFTGYGMSELPIPLVGELNGDSLPGYCGRPRSGIECRIVDNHDIEVPDGTVGELIVRSTIPWSISHGYVNNPEATAVAWRNGWFHTGDAFRCGEDGSYYFVDRIKDAIRRRGENISSFEVEKVVLQHPAVIDAAAVPVPSVLGEDEVLVALQLRPGNGLDPSDLIAFLVERMAHFMVPRYVRIFDELPRTPTGKVKKPLLREQGVTADTWDRDAAGIVVRRERLS